MTFTLATFNLKDFFDARAEAEAAAVQAKLEHTADKLRQADADVVALQEVGSEALLEALIREVSPLGYGPPTLGTADKRGIRCAILSRRPVLRARVHTADDLPFPTFIDGDPAPFTGRLPLRRGIPHVVVDAGALGEVHVLTAHFKSGLPVRRKFPNGEEIPDVTPADRAASRLRSLVQRAAEALFARGLVDEILSASAGAKVCVMGDLNDVADSLPVRVVRGVGAAPAEAVLAACADHVPAERRFSTFHGGGKNLIDHILVTPPLAGALASADILNGALRDHGPHVDGAPLTPDSDHALVLARFAAT